MHRLAAFLVVVVMCRAAVGSAQTATDSMVASALRYAGGEVALRAARSLEWKGRATIHIPGREIELYGHWRVLPPDSAIVATYEVNKGPSSTRRLILAGPRGWLRRDTTLTPMPPDVLAEERHQFYLYSLLQILPLRQSTVQITRASAGTHSLLVNQPGRLPVFMYVAPSGQVLRMATRFASADGTPGDSQEVHLSGAIEAAGVRWFRHLKLLRNGAPYFDLYVDTLWARPALRDPLLRGPAKPD